MKNTFAVYNLDAIPGLDVIEHYEINTMTPSTESKVQARARYKRWFGIALMVIATILLTSVVEVRATTWPAEPPVPTPAPSADAAAQAAAKAAAQAKAEAAARAAAESKSQSGAQADVFAPINVEGSKAQGGAAKAATGPVNAGGGAAGAQASNGPINVTPSNEYNSSTLSRALALAFPSPVAPAITASNCIVAGSSGWAVGFNFLSRTSPSSIEAPVCSLRAMAAEADMACQYRTAAELRAEAAAIVLKRDAKEVPDTVQDLSPEQCLLLRQPRLVMPQANTTYVDASQWQSTDSGAEQRQQIAPPPVVTPPPRARVAPRAAPVPVPVTPTCAQGETAQCMPQRSSPGSFNDLIGR